MPFPAQSVQFGANPGSDPNVVPYTNTTVSVTSAATSICTVPANGAPVYLVNGATQIFLGNSNAVTASATVGYPVPANAVVLLTYGMFGTLNQDHPGGAVCTLYGITASSTSTVTVGQVTTWPGNE